MSTIYSRVSRVATWAGWCSPCEREDRPLVLTRSGPGGLTSWLSGLSDEDRLLLLTCRVCGQWQFVPAREEDDPEVLLEDDDPIEQLDVRQVAAATAASQSAVAELVTAAREAATVPPAARIPAGRVENLIQAPPVERAVEQPVDVPVDVLAELPQADTPEAPVAPTAPPAEAPAAEVAAVVPAPRTAVERIVTVPDSVTLPAFSPEAVEAAARVLSAARAQVEPPAPRSAPHTGRRSSPDRSRHAARPARRTEHGTAEVAGLTPALPAVLGMPTGTRQVVLAAAS